METAVLVRRGPAGADHHLPTVSAGDEIVSRAEGGAACEWGPDQHVHLGGTDRVEETLATADLPGAADGRVQLHVARIAGRVPADATEPVQLLRQRGHGHPSSRQPGRNDGRHAGWVLEPNLRAKVQHHRDVHYRRGAIVPVHLRQQQEHHRGRLLRAVHGAGRLGGDPHPLDGAVARFLPDFCRGHLVPAGQLGLIGQLDDRNNDW